MCACVHVCMRSCVWGCVRACMRTCVHACACARVCTCVHVFTCVHACTRVLGEGTRAVGGRTRLQAPGVGVPARSGSYTSNQWAPMQARFHSQPQFQHHSSWHWGCGHFMCMHPPAGRGHRLSAGERSSPHPPHTRAAPETALHGHHPERAEENQPERARAFRGAACSKSAPSTEGAAWVSTRASTFPLPKWGLETSASRRTDGIKSFLNDVLN